MDDFVAELGYPSAGCMRGWIRRDPRRDPDRATYKSRPVLTKLECIRRVSEGQSCARAGAAAGVGASTVAYWADRYARGGTAALLPASRVGRGSGMAGRARGEGRRPAPVMQAPPGVPAEAGIWSDETVDRWIEKRYLRGEGCIDIACETGRPLFKVMSVVRSRFGEDVWRFRSDPGRSGAHADH